MHVVLFLNIHMKKETSLELQILLDNVKQKKKPKKKQKRKKEERKKEKKKRQKQTCWQPRP